MDEVEDRLRFLRELPVATDTDADLGATFALARQRRLSFYDALYLALALRCAGRMLRLRERPWPKAFPWSNQWLPAASFPRSWRPRLVDRRAAGWARHIADVSHGPSIRLVGSIRADRERGDVVQSLE